MGGIVWKQQLSWQVIGRSGLPPRVWGAGGGQGFRGGKHWGNSESGPSSGPQGWSVSQPGLKSPARDEVNGPTGWPFARDPGDATLTNGWAFSLRIIHAPMSRALQPWLGERMAFQARRVRDPWVSDLGRSVVAIVRRVPVLSPA